MIRTHAVVAAILVAAAAVSAEAQQPQQPKPPPPVPSGAGPTPQQQPRGAAGSASRAPYAAGRGMTAGPSAADNMIARGKRLVDTHDCHACHTPMKMGANGPEPDMSVALSGHPEKLKMPPPPKLDGVWGWVGSASNTAFAGPWGITYAVNLTSDPDTGIGKLEEKDFVQAIKTGKHLGVGRPIMPPMPWPAYKNLNDGQLRAIYAYLKSVPPIKNKVPDYVPPK